MTKKTDRHEKLRQNVNFISEDQTFMKAINAKRASVIRTGFGNIDNILGGGLTNTLYVLGSETSTGKTAIMTTFAKNAAEQDVDVFYFALEMNKIELYARGIAAESYKNSLKDKKCHSYTIEDIIFQKIDYSEYEIYNKSYFEKHKTICIIDQDTAGSIGGYSAQDVYDTVKGYEYAHPDRRIMVVVDYLQYLKPECLSATDKQSTDAAIRILKGLSSTMPVIAASSYSRKNYGGGSSTESYKESGNIEYTGGILIGWDWNGFTDVKSRQERKETEQLCNERGYREMTFSVLKNRNGKRGAHANLLYYPEFDYFEEAKEAELRANTLRDSKSKRKKDFSTNEKKYTYV